VQQPALVAFTFNPTTIGGGGNSTGAITLNGPAPSGTSVALSRSNTTAADFPATVTVQPNATQAAFTATGKMFTGADRNVTVTASYLGGARTATLTVRGTKGKEKEKEEEKLAKEKEEEKSKEKEKEGKEKEEEKVTKEKESDFLTSGGSRVEGPGTGEESGPDSVEDGPAPGRPFVRPDERAVTGQRALDQPPAE